MWVTRSGELKSVNYVHCECEYSHHLNTNHLNTGQYGCLVFQWLNHMTWQTIQIPEMLDHKQAFFSLVFRPPFRPDHLTTGHKSTIWISDLSGLQLITVWFFFISGQFCCQLWVSWTSLTRSVRPTSTRPSCFEGGRTQKGRTKNTKILSGTLNPQHTALSGDLKTSGPVEVCVPEWHFPGTRNSSHLVSGREPLGNSWVFPKRTLKMLIFGTLQDFPYRYR